MFYLYLIRRGTNEIALADFAPIQRWNVEFNFSFRSAGNEEGIIHLGRGGKGGIESGERGGASYISAALC